MPPGWYRDPQTPQVERWWDGHAWTAQTRAAPVPPAKQKRSTGVGWWLAGAFAFLLVALVVAVVITSQAPAPDKTNSATTKSTPAEHETPTTSTPVDAAEASRSSAAMSSAMAEATAREQDKTQFKNIGDRDWQLIAKNPDAHLGEKVVIYGKVTQADSVTGDDYIRVSTEAQPADYYTINTIAKEGVNGVFANVVEGDIVTMWVRVWGTKTYDTTLGGSTTAPEVKVNVIEVTGHE